MALRKKCTRRRGQLACSNLLTAGFDALLRIRNHQLDAAQPAPCELAQERGPFANSRQRAIRCRIFTPAQPEYPAASVRDYCSGVLSALSARTTFQEVKSLADTLGLSSVLDASR